MDKRALKYEKDLTGQVWESDRARKRRLQSLNRQGFNGNAGRLLTEAARFAERDNASRGRRRFGMIEPAHGDGKAPTFKERQDVCITYHESARTLLGY